MSEQPTYQKIVRVHELIEMCQHDQTKSDADLAAVLGLSEGGYSMIRTGKLKLPVSAVKPLAEALCLPPQVLLIAWLQDYAPELLSALCEIFEPFPLSPDERLSILDARERAAVDDTD